MSRILKESPVKRKNMKKNTYWKKISKLDIELVSLPQRHNVISQQTQIIGMSTGITQQVNM